jgi:hypothetical protein
MFERVEIKGFSCVGNICLSENLKINVILTFEKLHVPPELINLEQPSHHLFFMIYYNESMYSVLKDKLQNCSIKQLYKYLHNDTSETEVNISISVNNDSENF